MSLRRRSLMKKRQLKLSQNKKDQKIFQVHRFRCHFFTAGSWEKDTQNMATVTSLRSFLFCDDFSKLLNVNIKYISNVRAKQSKFRVWISISFYKTNFQPIRASQSFSWKKYLRFKLHMLQHLAIKMDSLISLPKFQAPNFIWDLVGKQPMLL